jgi:hypothetical protein
MTEHYAREVTTERRPAMDHLLLHAQAWWDAQRFDQRAWQVAAWREQKLRHIQLHAAKALGKVVAAYTYCISRRNLRVGIHLRVR